MNSFFNSHLKSKKRTGINVNDEGGFHLPKEAA